MGDTGVVTSSTGRLREAVEDRNSGEGWWRHLSKANHYRGLTKLCNQSFLVLHFGRINEIYGVLIFVEVGLEQGRSAPSSPPGTARLRSSGQRDSWASSDYADVHRRPSVGGIMVLMTPFRLRDQ